MCNTWFLISKNLCISTVWPKNKQKTNLICVPCAQIFFYLLTLLKEFNLIILIMNVSLTFSVMLAFLIIKSTDIGEKQVWDHRGTECRSNTTSEPHSQKSCLCKTNFSIFENKRYFFKNKHKIKKRCMPNYWKLLSTLLFKCTFPVENLLFREFVWAQIKISTVQFQWPIMQ